MKYQLKKPIKFGDEIIDSVELKEEYCVGDQIRLQNVTKLGGEDGKTVLNRGDLLQETLEIGLDWPAVKVKKLSPADGIEINRIINDFFLQS